MTIAMQTRGRAGAVVTYAVPDLYRCFDRAEICAVVRAALIDHDQGRTFAPPPTHLQFEDPTGDCHIKVGGSRQGHRFVIKVSTGFYQNAALGLPTNNGFQALMDARTGQPLAFFEDEGLLTSWRTAAAAIEAATLVTVEGPCSVGIVGCGEQGELIASWLPERMLVGEIVLWNRMRRRADDLATNLRAKFPEITIRVAQTVAEVAALAQILFTATPSRTPHLEAAMFTGSAHIIALGADTPGKVEVAPDLVARAVWIATDDLQQCIHHGDYGAAVRAGLRTGLDADSLGRRLAVAPVPLNGVSLVDLTGLAAQDLAIAGYFYDRLTAA